MASTTIRDLLSIDVVRDRSTAPPDDGDTEWLAASHIGPAQRQDNGFPHNIGLAGTRD
jgi:hypothetical protein